MQILHPHHSIVVYTTPSLSKLSSIGTGAAKIYNEAIQRGAIGKGLRAFDKWWNRDEIAKQEIAKMKEDKRKAESAKQREVCSAVSLIYLVIPRAYYDDYDDSPHCYCSLLCFFSIHVLHTLTTTPYFQY